MNQLASRSLLERCNDLIHHGLIDRDEAEGLADFPLFDHDNCHICVGIDPQVPGPDASPAKTVRSVRLNCRDCWALGRLLFGRIHIRRQPDRDDLHVRQRPDLAVELSQESGTGPGPLVAGDEGVHSRLGPSRGNGIHFLSGRRSRHSFDREPLNRLTDSRSMVTSARLRSRRRASKGTRCEP